MFAAGQKVVGHTRYADVTTRVTRSGARLAGRAARRVPGQANPEADVSYTTAFGQASTAFGTATPSQALAAWSRDMGKLHTDLTKVGRHRGAIPGQRCFAG